jgi:pectinesterase
MSTRRQILSGLAAALGTGFTARSGTAGFDAVVTARPGIAGRRVFASLGDAVAAAPPGGAKPYRILLANGWWREKLVIDKPNIHLVGAGRDETVLACNAAAGDLGADGKPIGTFKTSTLSVRAAGFCAAHLTIANDFDYVAHLPPPVPADKTGPGGSQAVALALEGAADRCLFEDVRLSGYQDTLFADAGRSLFRASLIEGCVDFVFGAGRAFFEMCEIRSRRRPGQDFNGYVAAPDTDIRQPVGLVFSRCRLTRAAGIAPQSAALGRPWRHTKTFPDGRYGDPGNVGACAYLDCWMDDHIIAEGWQPMGYNAKDGSRAELPPEQARLFEYRSIGPGAGLPSSRRRFLTDAEARAFSIVNVLQGWNG